MIRQLTKRALILTIIYSGLVTAGGVGYFYSKRIEKVHADVSLSGLPKQLDGLKIGVMADFHAGAFATKKDILKAITAIKEWAPSFFRLD